MDGRMEGRKDGQTLFYRTLLAAAGCPKRYDIENFSIVRALNKEQFYGKSWRNVHQKLVPDPSLILVNNPKQPLHAINSFENKIF